VTRQPASARNLAQSAGWASGRGVFILAFILAGLAGWVDGVGFVHWHGLFVSFMSGNTTQTGAAAGADWPSVIRAGRTVLVFVLGVLLGELIAAPCRTWGRPVVLLVESILLWLGVGASAAGWGDAVVSSVLGLAMGIQNASVYEVGRISIALTYVTGTLVKIGRGMAEALRGAGQWRAIIPYLGLWSALLAGAFAGAAMACGSEAAALVVAASAAGILCVLTMF